MADAPAPAQIALLEYNRRSALAKRKVATGEAPADVIERELAAWGAIALLAGAPVLLPEIAEYRRAEQVYPGPRRAVLLPEREARCDLARDLCGPNTWGPILARARDAAIARADTPERTERARNLCILARALDAPLTPASCAAPIRERKAA